MMIWSEAAKGQGQITVTVPDKATLFSDLAQRFDTRQGFSIATINLLSLIHI